MNSLYSRERKQKKRHHEEDYYYSLVYLYATRRKRKRPKSLQLEFSGDSRHPNHQHHHVDVYNAEVRNTVDGQVTAELSGQFRRNSPENNNFINESSLYNNNLQQQKHHFEEKISNGSSLSEDFGAFSIGEQQDTLEKAAMEIDDEDHVNTELEKLKRKIENVHGLLATNDGTLEDRIRDLFDYQCELWQRHGITTSFEETFTDVIGRIHAVVDMMYQLMDFLKRVNLEAALDEFQLHVQNIHDKLMSDSDKILKHHIKELCDEKDILWEKYNIKSTFEEIFSDDKRCMVLSMTNDLIAFLNPD